MKTDEIRELSLPEITRKVAELRRELLHTRFQQAGQQLKNLLKLRTVRREIARLLTILREKGEK